MEAGGLKLEFNDNGIAVITMGNGENKFNQEMVRRWHEIMDTVER